MAETARDIAVRALADRSGNVTARLDRLLSEGEVRGADVALARELALGSVRRRGTLDALLRAFLERPRRPLPETVRMILHVALYQILFLDRVPDFAAVDEAVTQAGAVRRGGFRGMVNGLLRSALRELSPAEAGRPPLETGAIPLGLSAFRRVGRPVFADPSARPADYLAAACSLPVTLARRWIERFSSLDGAMGVALNADARAPLILRVNTLRADVPGVLARLAEAGVPAEAHANGLSVVLPEHGNVTDLAVFREGLVQPQDASATAVGLALDVREGMKVLDFCAAPGTKTTHLAELMGNSGEVTAVDVSDEKLRRIEENRVRLGTSIVRTVRADQAGGLPAEGFDRVLADVPCSNTGVLARRAEARWRFSEERLAKLVRDQKTLAALAAGFVRPGGKLVYSTCSIEPEEGDGVAEFLAREARMTCLRREMVLPGGAGRPREWHDGGYVAIFEKR